MNKKLSVFLAAVLVATMAACAGTPETPAGSDSSAATSSSEAAGTEESAPDTTTTDSDLSGSIVFMTHMTNVLETTMKDMKEAYEAAHPGTEIELEGVKDPENVIKTRMAANEAPDILGVIGNIKPDDYPKYYVALDDLGYTQDDLIIKMGTDGKQYGYAFSMGYYGVIYNKKVFAEAGITEVPKTVEELYDICEILKAKDIIPMATNYKDVWQTQFYNIFYANEASGDAGYLNTIAQGDEIFPEGSHMIEGMSVLDTLINKGYVEPDIHSTNWEEYQKDMASGKMAMSYMIGGILPHIAKFGDINDLGMFPFPGVKTMYTSPDWTYAISTDTKNEPLAKDFFKYLWTDSNYANAASVPTPLKKEKQAGFEWIDEFKSFGLPELVYVENSNFTTAIVGEYQLNWGQMSQEYVSAPDKAAYIADCNKRWAEARAKVIEDGITE